MSFYDVIKIGIGLTLTVMQREEFMHIAKKLAASAVLAATVLAGGAWAQDKEYRFVMVSHIGSNDANMGWLTESLKAFEERYPNVTTEYISTNQYSVQEHVRLLEQAIATQPDGIAVPIVDPDAFEGPLRKAIGMGIPVVAFNIPDGRDADERIPYLTYVGGDEYKTGLMLGQQTIAAAEAGTIPKPTGAVCAVHDAAHQGLKARCAGMSEAMGKIDVKVEELFISADAATARNTLQSYLSANADTNLIFTVAPFSAPWAYSAAADLGLSPDVDGKGVTLVTVDAHPTALAGIKQGKVLATNSQGFWLQGFVPMEWLYWYHEFGYSPASDILTGPVVITPDTIDHWEGFVRKIFGDAYDEQVSW